MNYSTRNEKRDDQGSYLLEPCHKLHKKIKRWPCTIVHLKKYKSPYTKV